MENSYGTGVKKTEEWRIVTVQLGVRKTEEWRIVTGQLGVQKAEGGT